MWNRIFWYDKIRESMGMANYFTFSIVLLRQILKVFMVIFFDV